MLEPTQTCPAPGGGPTEVRAVLDGGIVHCWAGPTWEAGVTFARGALDTAPDGTGIVLAAYAYANARSAKTQAFDAEGRSLPGCVVIDSAADGQWARAELDATMCPGAAFARVTAHSSIGADVP